MSLERLRKLGSEKPPKVQQPDAPATPAVVLEQTSREFEQIQNELREIDILVRQSTTEVEKLAQRNAQLTNKLRTMESNIDTVPRQDIKEIYNAAQEAQMRLFMMRGQVEQLQSRQENLKRYAESLRRILDVSNTLIPAAETTETSKARLEDGEGSSIVKIISAQ